MSTGRIVRLVSMVVFGLVLLGLLNWGGSVEIYGFSLPGWVAALVAYLLGWAATYGYIMDQKS